MFDFLKSIFSGGSSENLESVLLKKPFLVDVRTPTEFAQGHPKGSVNIPLDKIQNQIAKFQGKEAIVVFCRSGNRSEQAKSILEANGISEVVNGGTWKNVAGYTG
ncbi:MAG: rhodanese-like domain-containing protein [Saprospiraceae bacterium]|jgi:rhodanese-related sulfurtransferase|nr:rhodanese-like domain-containing protein [Saprospiraceae bacterium]